jgi:hypothetical protein
MRTVEYRTKRMMTRKMTGTTNMALLLFDEKL